MFNDCANALPLISVEGYLSSSVEVFIRVLDINDNAPQLSREYQPYICEGIQAGEVKSYTQNIMQTSTQ